MNCNKIALGHHTDDLLETFLLNMMFNGTLKSMPPILKSDDGRNTVIRPLAYCREAEVEEFAALMCYPIIPCGMCGSQPHLKRKRMKKLISDLSSEIPTLRDNMLASLGRIIPSHLLDDKLFDFKKLGTTFNDSDESSEQ
jgi:tRNA 2-thiocytidine biosynthesis protein TtcA